MHIGLHVIATARRIEAMTTLSAVGITTLELDVTVPESVASVREEVIRLCDGKLDILINNAYVLLLHSLLIIR